MPKLNPEKPGDPRLRAQRFMTERELVVNSKTIGTSLCYRLTTDDISHTGLLLSWDHHTSVPFRQNTLIEMEIDPIGEWLTEPLSCVGKVVRRFDNVENKIKFGISIVQMDGESIKEWEDCIGHLEKRQKQFQTSNYAA